MRWVKVMTYDVLIKDVLIPLKGSEVIQASILINEGIVSKIVKDYTPYLNRVSNVIRGKGLIVIPGGIDIHAHIYDPDYTHHEDFKQGSISAIYGGITTFFDMPLRMYVDNLRNFLKKYDEGVRSSLINFGIHAGMMNEDNISNIRELMKYGVKGFKLFTCKPFRPKTDEGIIKALIEINKQGALPIVHAEDDGIIDYLVNTFKKEGREDPLAHHESRPSEAEAIAIRKVIEVAKLFNLRVHIAHVSSELGMLEVKRGKELGVKVTAETCPQYLYFTRDDVRRLGNLLKMNPSIKSIDDVKALWNGLARGVIDAVATDHAPSTKEEKEGSIWDAWGGIPSLEVMIPLTYTLGCKRLGILTLERFIDVISVNPAKIVGLYPRKGSLMPGADADIVLLEPNVCFKVDASKLHQKVDWSPYEGLELCGWPKYVLINGYLVLDNGVLDLSVKAGGYISKVPKGE